MTRRPFGHLGLGLLVLTVALLVAAGLGWVTVSALQVEEDHRTAAALADRGEKERLALWRLDGRVFPALGLEGYRQYEHFTALYAPPSDLPGGPQYLSPLVSVELPEWMPLHFEFDAVRGWTSPQVLPQATVTRLADPANDLDLTNLTDARRHILAELNRRFPAARTAEALKELDADASESSAVVVTALTQRGGDVAKSDLGFKPSATPELPPPGPLQTAAKSQAPGQPGRGGFATPPPFAGNPANQMMQSTGTRGPADVTINDDPNSRRNFNARVGGDLKGGLGNPQVWVNPAEATPDFVGPPTPEWLNRSTEDLKKNLNDQVFLTPPATTPGGRGSAPSASAALGATGGRPGGGFGGGTQAGATGGPGPGPPATSPSGAARGAGAAPPAPRGMAPLTGPGAAMRAVVPPSVPPGEQKTKDADRAEIQKSNPKQESEAPAGGGAGGGVGLAKAAEQIGPGRDFAFGVIKRDDGPLAVKKPAPPAPPVAVHLGPMRPKWLTDGDGNRELIVVRPARLEGRTVYQGVLLDWEKLRSLLREEVADDFPAADLVPGAGPSDAPQRQLSALPVRFDSGPAPVLPPAGWTPLRYGLGLAWLAATVSLVAVWFGGRSLVDLSERRIRFVSAVTHELRTPLTSLRLYLDMLTSGMVKDEVQKQEYLTTLSHESDRLNQLIENVLDFAKLEKRADAVAKRPVPVAELLDHARETWAARLAADGKEFVALSTVSPDQTVTADPRVAQQILGNLIDNARKYSPSAADPRVWLWVKPAGKRIAFEVEDRGPGIPLTERSSIFRPFCRGGSSGATGGAGLGLALAKQWAESLGGKLTYRPADGGTGACFRVELPI